MKTECFCLFVKSLFCFSLLTPIGGGIPHGVLLKTGPGGNVGQLIQHMPLWTVVHETVQCPLDTESREGARAAGKRGHVSWAPDLVDNLSTGSVSELITGMAACFPVTIEGHDAGTADEPEGQQARKFSRNASARLEQDATDCQRQDDATKVETKFLNNASADQDPCSKGDLVNENWQACRFFTKGTASYWKGATEVQKLPTKTVNEHDDQMACKVSIDAVTKWESSEQRPRGEQKGEHQSKRKIKSEEHQFPPFIPAFKVLQQLCCKKKKKHQQNYTSGLFTGKSLLMAPQHDLNLHNQASWHFLTWGQSPPCPEHPNTQTLHYTRLHLGLLTQELSGNADLLGSLN